MASLDPATAGAGELARMVSELEQAELYEQRLRGLIVAVRDELAAGHTERALSMLNQALNEIDSATDVVVPGRSDIPKHP
jgi:hypothetical protein